MKREIKIVGIEPYNTTFNGNNFVGTKYHYVYKKDGADGVAVSTFKIPFNRVNDFPRIALDDEWIAYIERTQNGERCDDLVPIK